MVSAASLFVSAWRGCSAQGKSRTVVPHGTGACLAIRPVFQGQHYKRVPQAGGQLQVVHCQQAPLVRFHQVRTDPLLWEDFDLPHFHLREFTPWAEFTRIDRSSAACSVQLFSRVWLPWASLTRSLFCFGLIC